MNARVVRKVLMEVSWRNPLLEGLTVYPVMMKNRDGIAHVEHGEFIGLVRKLDAARPDTIKIDVKGVNIPEGILSDPMFSLDHGAYRICSAP
ncbi:MAG: hypothetical protein JW754_02400 [Candidatus Aenigmarchaeota archaeon]|nr:hypothetical protein [Candidatus Aenigmarchaeota archaeon]